MGARGGGVVLRSDMRAHRGGGESRSDISWVDPWRHSALEREGKGQRRANGGPTGGQRGANGGPTGGQRGANGGPTWGHCGADTGPTRAVSMGEDSTAAWSSRSYLM
ncbi:unnamed protein product [Arctogadus glacialis]